MSRPSLRPPVPAWVDHAVFYQVYPQAFYDSNGDGIGDLSGLIEKLDYIADLGVNAIWVSPFFQSPMRDAGYDVADFYAVDPRYGTNGDARRLFSEAKRRGIRVLLDVVAGHTSIDHPWFRASCAEQSPERNWYVWTDRTWDNGGAEFRSSMIHGYCNRDGNFLFNFFWHQPALNYGFAHPDQPWQLPTTHPDVRALWDEMINVLCFWLREGASGFRVDMAGSITKNDPDKSENRRFFTGWAPFAERIVEAFNAGIDLMLWPGEAYFDAMEHALGEGSISGERLDQSVRRILALKARLGVDEMDAERRDPHALPLVGDRVPAEIGDGARTLARNVAEKSLTLVRNRLQLLPLDPRKTKRILLHKAVAPAPAQCDSLDELVAALRNRGVELTILENGNCLDVWNLEKKGERWDAYLVVFSQQVHQMKNAVRPVGSAAEVMWTLQNTNTLRPIVVSLGTPFLLRDMPFLDTLINGYSPCTATFEALVRALFGELPFTGQSPVDLGGAWF